MKRIELLCKLNFKKPFISSVLSMWSTQASTKKKIIFEPSQPSCKLNQKCLPLVFSPCDQPIQVEIIELFLDLHNDLANKIKTNVSHDTKSHA
jgi:hypothetical protein